MTPSTYQKDIYQATLVETCNIAINAGPGSGKTTTIVEASKLIPYGKRAIFLAYNKKIVEELKERLPGTIQCSTMHSLGASVLFKSSRRQVQIKPEKQLPFIIQHYQKEIDEKKKVWGEIFDIEFTMKLVRATMTNYREKEEIDQLFQDHNIFHSDKELERLQLALDDFYEYNNREWGNMNIDFQDMIELIVMEDIPLPQFDYVFVDECFPYDTNISTDKGSLPIGSIVEKVLKGENVLVESFNEEKEVFEYKLVTNGFIKGKRNVCEVKLAGKLKLRSTLNHRYLTTSGWQFAGRLKKGDFLISNYKDQPYHRVLNDDQKQMVVGSIMGDGYYDSPNNNGVGRISVIHGEKQKEYIEWKSSVMCGSITEIEENGYSSKKAYKFQTKQFFSNCNFNDKERLVQEIDVRSLAISYMDDGTLIKNSCCSIFSFAASEKLSTLLSKEIYDKYSIKSSVKRKISSSSKKPYWEIFFDSFNTRKFHRMILKYIHPSMMYKIRSDFRFSVDSYEWNDNYKGYGVIEVTDVCREAGKEVVFDIEVQDNHNFIVESKRRKGRGVVAHNCQDMSKLDTLFIEKLIKKPLGRLISVFDEKQTIYGWRGSDMDSVEYFSSRPNTKKLPLSICYRCPKSHVELAKTIYPDIEYFEKNGEGVLNREGKIQDISPGDMVICRNNRPLVSLYFKLVRRGIPCKIVGKEIEKGLLNMVKRIDGEGLDEGLDNLKIIQNNYEKELKNKGITNLNRNPKWISFCDKVEVIRTIAMRRNEEGELVCENMKDVEGIITEMFEERRYGELVQLLTVHKSKGLENDRIFLVTHYNGKELMPSDYAITEKQKVQEKNLLFVAYTRAKKELHFIKL